MQKKKHISLIGLPRWVLSLIGPKSSSGLMGPCPCPLLTHLPPQHSEIWLSSGAALSHSPFTHPIWWLALRLYSTSLDMVHLSGFDTRDLLESPASPSWLLSHLWGKCADLSALLFELILEIPATLPSPPQLHGKLTDCCVSMAFLSFWIRAVWGP